MSPTPDEQDRELGRALRRRADLEKEAASLQSGLNSFAGAVKKLGTEGRGFDSSALHPDHDPRKAVNRLQEVHEEIGMLTGLLRPYLG